MDCTFGLKTGAAMKPITIAATALTAFLLPPLAFASGEVDRAELIEQINNTWLGLPALTNRAIKVGEVVEITVTSSGNSAKTIWVDTKKSGREGLPALLIFSRKDVLFKRDHIRIDVDDGTAGS